MGSLIDQFNKLQQDVADAKAAAERAQGSLDQLMKQLKEEFGCGTLKEAKRKIERLERLKHEAKLKFEKLMKKYEEDWH